MGTFANEELLKLADDYQLKTLAGLCRTALEPWLKCSSSFVVTKSIQIANIMNKVNMGKKSLPEKVRPDQETVMLHDQRSSLFHSQFPILLKGKCTQPVMEIQKQDIFFVGCFPNKTSKSIAYEVVIHLLSADISRFGFSIVDAFFCDTEKSKFHKIRGVTSKKTTAFQRSATRPISAIKINSLLYSIDVKVVSTIDNYYYQMMDRDWMTDFWTATTNKKNTDVEIFVGTVKVMEAHRLILSARSPVMKEALIKNCETGKYVFRFEAEFDAAVVENFWNFLYTSSLETFACKYINYKQLLKLATLFEVETLKNICQ